MNRIEYSMKYSLLLSMLVLCVGCASTEKKQNTLPSTEGVEATSSEISSAVTSALSSNASASKLIDEAIKLNLKAQKSIK
jgi:predicted component of type VI protein secretion system